MRRRGSKRLSYENSNKQTEKQKSSINLKVCAHTHVERERASERAGLKREKLRKEAQERGSRDAESPKRESQERVTSE